MIPLGHRAGAGTSSLSEDVSTIQAVRYPRLPATIGAPPSDPGPRPLKGSTYGLSLQAWQGLRPEHQGRAGKAGDQGTSRQAGEPPQTQGVWTALHQAAVVPLRASTD